MGVQMTIDWLDGLLVYCKGLLRVKWGSGGYWSFAGT